MCADSSDVLISALYIPDTILMMASSCPDLNDL